MLAACAPTMVVNNAAAQTVQSLDDMGPDDWRAMLSTNVDGPFLVTRRAAERWGGRGGAVVNIASIEGSDPAVGHAHYATSKAGLLMFSRAAALEYGSRGIRVNCVAPGFVRSNPATERQWQAYGPEGQEALVEGIALRRLGTPSDIASAVLFLASDRASWITGQVLPVDGGK